MKNRQTSYERMSMNRIAVPYAAKKAFGVLMILLLLAMLLPMLSLQTAAETAVADATATAGMTVDVGIPVEEYPELFITRSMPTHGEGGIAVFLIDFPDYRNDNPMATAEYYDSMYFSGGVETDWDDETVANFFYEESYGKLHLSGKVFDWYTAKHERSYYDNRKAELVMEAAEHYLAQGVDFSQFDGDNDGVIDAIVYHFAGEASNERYSAWYSGVTSSNPNGWGKIGDLTFKTMVQVDERTATRGDAISTVCHELVHTLGMPDLYTERRFATFPTNDLMSNNIKTINPYLKMMLGWVETVQVITEETENIRLDKYGNESPGDIAIVTRKYNGLFDEFYLVAYRYFKDGTAVVWHIDARLNEDKTSFLYQNLYYDPRPDQKTTHTAGKTSAHPMIMEISSTPEIDYILGSARLYGKASFGEHSVLGPDHVPSSDTNDGGYTGIRLDHFEIHDQEYLTFDLSFVEDTTPPTVVTEDSNIKLMETATIRFNEYIYEGDHWNDIRITDLNGNALDATILLPNYPKYEIDITFENNSYDRGYQIIFPEGCVRDSAGNDIAAITLVASTDGYLFPITTEQFVSSQEYLRDTTWTYFFPDGNTLVGLTRCWENRSDGEYISDAKIEFVRLDLDGNVLLQTFIDNPFENTPIDNIPIDNIYETGDGYYIVTMSDWGDWSRMFCIDANGELAWINDDYYQSGKTLSNPIPSEQGLWVKLDADDPKQNDEWMYILSETGKLQGLMDIPEENLKNLRGRIFRLSDGTVICQSAFQSHDKESGLSEYGSKLRVLNAQTLQEEKIITHGISEKYNEELKMDPSFRYILRQIQENDNGTKILIYETAYSTEAVLLDIEWKVVKWLPLEMATIGILDNISWFENDGFCEIIQLIQGNHDNSRYHVRRYDKSLNLLWKTDVTADFVHFFHSSTGEIKAFRSMYLPERECYIDSYGSEEAYRTPHIHNLTHVAGIPATCLETGFAEYWRCNDCGCWYSDEQCENLITDPQTLVLPLAIHREEILPAVEPTCTAVGLTEGKKCTVCGEILTAQKTVAAKGHSEEKIPAVEPTCTATGLTEGKKCTVCGEILTAQKTVTAKGHSEEMIPAVEASCTATGLTEGKKCTVCGEILLVQETVAAKGHTHLNACDPDCESCGEMRTPADHTYGEWVIVTEATRKEAGKQERTCSVCGYTESEAIEFESGIPPIAIVGIIGGGAVICAVPAVSFVLIRKRRMI